MAGPSAACLTVLSRLLLATAAAADPPVAVAPTNAFSYSRRVWQSADGLPEDLAQAVTETPDGYLWIGTSGGLVRFDGVRFTVFNHENQSDFVDDSVYSLLTARDGTLWAGTEGGGLIRLRQGIFRRFGVEEGLRNRFVRVVFEDRKSGLWVGTDGGLFRLQNGAFTRIDGRDGLPEMSVHSICEDRDGRLLVGGTGLIVLGPDPPAYYASRESMADNNIRAIRETADGSIWIATISGLRRLRGGVVGDPFAAPKLIHGTNTCVLLESRRGPLWIGTYGRGMMRHEDARLTRFTAPTSLPHNNVLALFEDSEDNVWVGTQGGLLRLSPSAGTTITTADGAPLSINTVYQDADGTLFVAALNGQLLRVADRKLVPVSLPHLGAELRIRNAFRDSAGALWLGTDGQGAVRIDGGRVAHLTNRQGLVNDFVRAFCEDREGSIWIGTDGGLSRWQSGRLESFAGPDQARFSIRMLLTDRAGHLWVANEGGLSRFENGRFVEDPLLEPLRGHKVWAVHEDAEGGIWAGTQGAGLFCLKRGRLTHFTTRHGLPNDKIHFITEDGRGHLWMSGPSGILSISRAEVEALGREPSRQLAVQLYTTAEGLGTNQMNGGVQPAGLLATTGELWFPSTKGVVRIDPDVSERSEPPPVLIERVLADDRPVAFDEPLLLAPGDGKLEIHYTAIRLRSPDRIRFKYHMEGFDRAWTAAGERRVAFYTNLPPGDYRFRVAAYELNDPQSSTEQTLQITWRPHFYQTAWFLALCAVVVGAVAWSSYRLHVRNIRRRFDAVLEERNRLAREMHDTLIQGCVGVSTLLEAASRAQEVSPRLSLDLLDRARSEVRATVSEARTVIWDLRHGANDGDQCLRAVAQLAAHTRDESGIPVHFESMGAPLAVDAEVERSLVMVIREALQNAIQHGAPGDLWVRLRFDGRGMEVEVEDDGCGFDPAAGGSGTDQHYGLIGMRERVERLGGTLRVESAPGNGTKVSLSVPVARLRRPAGGS